MRVIMLILIYNLNFIIFLIIFNFLFSYIYWTVFLAKNFTGLKNYYLLNNILFKYNLI